MDNDNFGALCSASDAAQNAMPDILQELRGAQPQALLDPPKHWYPLLWRGVEHD